MGLPLKEEEASRDDTTGGVAGATRDDATGAVGARGAPSAAEPRLSAGAVTGIVLAGACCFLVPLLVCCRRKEKAKESHGQFEFSKEDGGGAKENLDRPAGPNGTDNAIPTPVVDNPIDSTAEVDATYDTAVTASPSDLTAVSDMSPIAEDHRYTPAVEV